MSKNNAIKNICFYSGDITNSGGTERVAIIIANELNKLPEYNVSFLSLVEKKPETFFEIDNTIERYTVYDKVVRGITHIGGIILRTRKILKENNIDILIDIDALLEHSMTEHTQDDVLNVEAAVVCLGDGENGNAGVGHVFAHGIGDLGGRNQVS